MSLYDLVAPYLPKKDAESSTDNGTSTNANANASANADTGAATGMAMELGKSRELSKEVKQAITDMKDQQAIDAGFVLALAQNNDVIAKEMLAAGKKPSAGLMAADGRPVDEKLKELSKGTDEVVRAQERNITLPSQAIAQLNAVQAGAGYWASMVRGQSQSIPIRGANYALAI